MSNKNKSSKVIDKAKLLAEVAVYKKELMSLRFKQKLGELTDTSLFRKAKKSIAKNLTQLNNNQEG